MTTKTTKTAKKKVAIGLILGIIPLLFLIYLAVAPFIHIISRDLSAKDMYVISEWVNVRAEPDKKSLKMGKIWYGTKVSCYGQNDGWSEVLIGNSKGYVFSKFIADAQSFYYLDGLFNDKKISKKAINTKFRMALVRYLKFKNFSTEVPEDVKNDLDYDFDKNEVYQLYIEPSSSKYKTFVFADFNGDGREDAAFVLSNKAKYINRLVILSLDKDNSYDLSKVLYETELEHSWQFIRLARKGTKYFGENENVSLKINGLIIGSNRNKTFKDKSYLLLYDGQNFNKY